MTTIAADLKTGMMAADSDWTDGDIRGKTRKIFRLRGALIGFAGSVKEIEILRVWFRKDCPGEVPDLEDEDQAALIMRPGYLATWNPVDGEVREHHHQYAIGTGGQVARGAMFMGASVRDAVRAAIAYDAQTSGAVRVYRLPSK